MPECPLPAFEGTDEPIDAQWCDPHTHKAIVVAQPGDVLAYSEAAARDRENLQGFIREGLWGMPVVIDDTLPSGSMTLGTWEDL